MFICSVQRWNRKPRNHANQSNSKLVSRLVCAWLYPLSSHWHIPVLPSQCWDPDGMRQQWPGRWPVCLPDWQHLSARGSFSSSSHSNSNDNSIHPASRRPHAADHTQHKSICNHSMSLVGEKKNSPYFSCSLLQGTQQKRKKNQLYSLKFGIWNWLLFVK